MPIQRLTEVVAAQIAAGEVVERPASVAKELIENALDAGARTIRVEAMEGGRRLLRISDDGSGIPSDEVELAFARHATSKLRSVDDLQHIQTLGFRGEALASIASVAQVTLRTRVADESTGTLLRIHGGELIEHRSIGAPPGTVLTVESLFYNTPVRLKFLKTENTERRTIDQLIMRYAMAYPNVRFSLMQDEKLVFQSTGNGSLADVLVEALGLDVTRSLIEVEPRPGLPIQVYGYSSAPSLQRNARNQITLFVNGRSIQDTSLTHAVVQAYHTLMPEGRFPVTVLLITLPSEEVDVNVHPTKAEVRFRAPDAVFSAVRSSVQRALIAFTQSAQAVPNVDVQAVEPDPNADTRPHSYGTPTRFDMDTPDPGYRTQPFANAIRSPYAPFGSSADIETGPAANMPRVAPTYVAPNNAPIKSNVPSLPPLRAVGQIAATYIVAEGPAGLYLVDQHAAHERILYEQFMGEQANHQPVAQLTMDGVLVEITPDAALQVAENSELLAAIGFTLEPFGDRMLKVRAVPALLADQDPTEAVKRVLDDLANGDAPGEMQIEARIILYVCKAAAVKAGQTLSYPEMQGLLQQLARCASPRSCPHGRPTLLHMSRDQLAKEFGRT
jgi:DNA mismatch repair protein MutL